MLYKFEYKDLEERELIISQNKDKYLIEEQNLLEGNFLIFSDEEPKPPEIILSPEELLNNEIKTIKEKMLEQDKVIEELMFVVIPSLIGGM